MGEITLNDELRLDSAKSMAEKLDELNDLKLDAKHTAAQYKAKIAVVEARIGELKLEVQTGKRWTDDQLSIDIPEGVTMEIVEPEKDSHETVVVEGPGPEVDTDMLTDSTGTNPEVVEEVEVPELGGEDFAVKAVATEEEDTELTPEELAELKKQFGPPEDDGFTDEEAQEEIVE